MMLYRIKSGTCTAWTYKEMGHEARRLKRAANWLTASRCRGHAFRVTLHKPSLTFCVCGVGMHEYLHQHARRWQYLSLYVEVG